jgi:hypothetical protein
MLVPIAVAAGVDQYLTVLLLALVPHTGLWEAALPGALDDLGAISVLGVALGFYLLEAMAERRTGSALAWNAIHGLIRPMAGGLLVLLLLVDQPPLVQAVGVLLGGLLAFLAHGGRAGLRAIFYLRGDRRAPRALLSALEDILVVGLIVLSLERPLLASAVVLVGGGVWLARAPSHVRGFHFAVALGIGRLWSMLGRVGWTSSDELPRWLRRRLSRESGGVDAPAIRGTRAGACGIPGTSGFVTGWLLLRENTPFFIRRRGAASHPTGLAAVSRTSIAEDAFFRRVEFTAEGRPGFLCVPIDGPESAAIEALFPHRQE